MTNPTRPPKHLSAESKKLWRSVLADYELEPRHEAILCTALEALDRLRQAQAQMAMRAWEWRQPEWVCNGYGAHVDAPPSRTEGRLHAQKLARPAGFEPATL